MAYMVDSKRRATLPAAIKPGSAVDYTPDGAGGWRLVVLESPRQDTARVQLRRGQWVVTSTPAPDTAKALRESRSER